MHGPKEMEESFSSNAPVYHQVESLNPKTELNKRMLGGTLELVRPGGSVS